MKAVATVRRKRVFDKSDPTAKRCFNFAKCELEEAVRQVVGRVYMVTEKIVFTEVKKC